MRLRNKKARGVYTLGEDVHIAHTEGGRIEVEIVLESGGFAREYFDSLAELNEEWEDVKEPLIKDERIRRAVRAWVEIGKYERVYYDRAYNRLADDHDFVHCIEFAIDPCPDAESGRCYTLTELCGEKQNDKPLSWEFQNDLGYVSGVSIYAKDKEVVIGVGDEYYDFGIPFDKFLEIAEKVKEQISNGKEE